MFEMSLAEFEKNDPMVKSVIDSSRVITNALILFRVVDGVDKECPSELGGRKG